MVLQPKASIIKKTAAPAAEEAPQVAPAHEAAPAPQAAGKQ